MDNNIGISDEMEDMLNDALKDSNDEELPKLEDNLRSNVSFSDDGIEDTSNLINKSNEIINDVGDNPSAMKNIMEKLLSGDITDMIGDIASKLNTPMVKNDLQPIFKNESLLFCDMIVFDKSTIEWINVSSNSDSIQVYIGLKNGECLNSRFFKNEELDQISEGMKMIIKNLK